MLRILLKLLWYNQRVLVYPSGFEGHPRIVDVPSEYHLPYEDVELITSDKVKLRCYLIRRDELDKARGTVVIFHGNAMNHGETLPRAAQLFYKDFNVLTVEYRGYGHSEGVPSEKGLCRDAQAAIDYIQAHPKLYELPIIIYGQSLGGAVAIHAASQNADKISALIVENTFTSIPDIIKEWPVFRHLTWLCTQRWKSAYNVARLPTSLPILMLSGLMDEVIPFKHMENLWAIAKKRGDSRCTVKSSNQQHEILQDDLYQSFPYGTHTTTCFQAGYWETVHNFLDRLFST